uniref:Chromatin modification-related protein EAF6 n=1 Tax=Polytomella parva TaxID=51329 RepID=A0A7S0UQB8_9CHLO|mmetsp:Transcript_10782/g.19669  ORF Transcript_10782/g.19669 Transcript_10782/m.19669 type:complete len:113 (+) Transcript_10782:171-509(+)
MIVDEYLQLRQQLESDVQKIEKVIYSIEQTHYDLSQCGSVFKGFEGYLSSKDNIRKKSRNIRNEDRFISLSSKTSQASRENELAQETSDAQANQFAKKGYTSKTYVQKLQKR